MSEPQESPNVSVEQNGRVLTGGPGTSVEALEQAIEREPAPTADAKTEQPTTDAKPTRGQARFSELSKQRDEERRKATEANERAVSLAERLEALEKRTAQAGTPVPGNDQSRVEAKPSQQVAAPSATRQKPSEDEIGTTYKTYGDYVEDLTDWKSEQREHRANEERAQKARVEGWQQRYQASLVQYPDFAEVLKSGPGGQVDVRQDYIDRLMETPGGEHAVYQMAKDAATAQRVDRMTEYEFGMFVRSLIPSEPVGAPPASPQAQRATKAPPPYQPVQAGGKTTATTSAEIAAKGGSMDEYRRKRAAERGVKPRY